MVKWRDCMFHLSQSWVHINRNYKARTPTLGNRSEKNEGKKTWTKIVRARSSRVEEIVIIQSNGTSDHTTSN